MWLKLIFLHVLLNPALAEVFRMCLEERSSEPCDPMDRLLSCQHGIANLTKFDYWLEDEPINECCTEMEAECTVPQPDILDRLKHDCTNKLSCPIPYDLIEKGKRQVGLGQRCGYDTYVISQIRIVFYCLQAKSLPATGGSGTTDTSEGKTTVIIAVTSVLAAIILVAVVVGFLVYKRRYRKNRDKENSKSTVRRTRAYPNNGFDEDYNTIPADYEVIPRDRDLTDARTYNELNNVRNDSVKYSTIVLKDDIDMEKKDYTGYDRTNGSENYDGNTFKDAECVHSYSKFNEEADDYNRLDKNSKYPRSDKDYSKFEGPDEVDDYSHLDDKENASKTMNDYNHLQISDKPIGQVKQTNGYEEPALKKACDDSGKAVSAVKADNHAADKRTHIAKVKRVDSYEQPVLTSTMGQQNENFPNQTTNYETPVNDLASENQTVEKQNDSTNDKVKRIDSYEEPVLKGNTDRQKEHTTEPRDDYEEPMINSVQSEADMVAVKRVGSYEEPVIMSRSEYQDKQPREIVQIPVRIK